jgi:hypothetical protein
MRMSLEIIFSLITSVKYYIQPALRELSFLSNPFFLLFISDNCSKKTTESGRIYWKGNLTEVNGNHNFIKKRNKMRKLKTPLKRLKILYRGTQILHLSIKKG